MTDDSNSMSVSDHLRELRVRLIYSLLAIVAAFVFCVFYQDEIMSIVTRPHTVAMEHLRQSRAAAANTPQNSQDEFDQIIARIQQRDSDSAQALKILREKQKKLQEKEEAEKSRLKVLKYQESFMNYLKVCIIAALIIASPFVLLQMWKFISAGLYEKEKRAVSKFVPFSYLLFAAGVLFGYYFLIPVAMYYLAGYGGPELIEVSITLENYLSFFLFFTIALGAMFQTPLVMLFLSKAGIVSAGRYAGIRKYVILAIFIVAAVVTPGPDVVSQILLAVPLLILYEIGILLSKMSGKRDARTKPAEITEDKI